MNVHEWLINKDYREGVELFSKLSDNDFLKSLFKEKSEYTITKLEVELRKFLIDTPITVKLDEAVEPIGATNQVEGKKFANQFLKTKLKHDLQQVYRHIDSNRFALGRCKSDKTRLEYALQILTLVERKRIIFEQMDYFDEHGELPTVKPKQTVFATPELQRLYVQEYKMRKRLEKPDDKLRNRAKSEQKLKEKQARIAELQGGSE
ncbi:hypothetical protein FM120_31435 [Sphingobacterium faecium PCAi_F2.5]|nr:hypothetical protein FM120_31435 [Sphingobacterium faecium PCAi_F2.5]